MNSEAEQIRSANDKFCHAMRRGDAAAIARLYTANARVLPPNWDFVDGPAAIQAFWAAVIQMGIDDAALETVDLEFLGDTAVETGRYRLRAGKADVDHGKYIVVWKNDHDAWKLHRDVWNSSMPAREATSSK